MGPSIVICTRTGAEGRTGGVGSFLSREVCAGPTFLDAES